MCASVDVAENLATADRLVSEAAAAGAEVVMLPEAFAFIGPSEAKQRVLEPLDGSGGATPILDWCRRASSRHRLDLVVGGFHEASEDPCRSYNTCLHLGPDGAIRSRYRKIHLFDVSLDDGTALNESARTLPGSALVTTEVAFGTLGLSVCYDVRFPMLYQALVDRGAVALAVPAAFTATTGAAHWHVLLRARAIETQCYVLAAAQHGVHHGGRRSYGHSVIIDPWGEVIAELDDGDGIVTAEVDPERVRAVRRQLPSLDHRRPLQ
jgi:predicted amidohydrolase